jgi:hypothetical protein
VAQPLTKIRAEATIIGNELINLFIFTLSNGDPSRRFTAEKQLSTKIYFHGLRLAKGVSNPCMVETFRWRSTVLMP